MNPSSVVFNIQRFSLHDGPGIRTTVFLKGCTMQCFWCHNPEGQQHAPELRYHADRCIACGNCVATCPHHAHELNDGIHAFIRERCELSGICVATCAPRALELEGRRMTVEEVMSEILPDQLFYELSGGGVTLSGGEPALSRDFARDLLRQCKVHGLHTALETCGEAPWSALEALLPFTDLVMMDIKLIDTEKHRAATRQSNERILESARRLAASSTPVIFRTPIVPSVNDSVEDISAIATFVRQLKEQRIRNAGTNGATAAVSYEIMPFHRLAAGKYASLGREYLAAAIDPPSHARMAELAGAARRQGIETLDHGNGTRL